MSKQVRVCKCGCIHFLDMDIIQNAIEHDKNTLFICGNCGKAIIIGADRVPNYYAESEDDPKECFDMYSYNADRHQRMFMLDANSFSEFGNHKPIDKVIYDNGYIVIMETGYRADYFNYNTGFEDMKYPDFSYHLSKRATAKEIMSMIEDYHRKRKKVNMNILIRDLTDEENEILSRAMIKGLDYSGTKWERQDGHI